MPHDLQDLIAQADHMRDDSSPDWLLRASQLSQAIGEAVLQNAVEIARIPAAVQHLADQEGCSWIIGASPKAEIVVSGLNQENGVVPTRALLFDLVRVTGAALSAAAHDIRPMSVVTAVLVDVSTSSDQPVHSIARALSVTPR